MACSGPVSQGQSPALCQPVLQGQSPALCQLCEVDSKIQWKCIDCDLLLCTKCKNKIHSKFKSAEEHKIINIKEIGKHSREPSVHDTTHTVNKSQVSLELSIMQEYKTKFDIDFIQVSPLDDSLWIGSEGDKKNAFFSFKSSNNLQKIKVEREKLKVISSFNVGVWDIAISPSNDLILTDLNSTLKQFFYNSNKVTESKYCVERYIASCVHVTRDYTVVVGVCNLKENEGAVYVMDINGINQEFYRHDKDNKLIFTGPYRITSTSTDTLCVIDRIEFGKPQGRLVMLKEGEVIHIHTGNPKAKEFNPCGIASTSSDNIIATDPVSAKLHILNNFGNVITYYNTREIGIKYPVSLAFNTVGQLSLLYIGCWSGEKEGNLYKLTLSGC